MDRLETERLVLRPFERDDLDAMTALHAEPSFWWFPLGRGMTGAEAQNWLDRHLTAQEVAAEPSVHAVVVKDTGELVGYAGLSVPHFLPEILPAVEVGWRLGAAYRGRGYATEAAAAALDQGFDVLGLDEIISIYEPANEASGRVMDRLGLGPGRPMVDPSHDIPIVVRSITKAAWRQP